MAMKPPRNNFERRNRSRGFSLVELLISMVVLAVGLLGGMIIILAAMASNSRSRFDSSAVALSQSTMDRIIVLSSSAALQQTQITDCNGVAHVINTAPGGAPLTNLATGNGTQTIDFTQAAVAGYQMLYTLCATGAADGLPTGNPQVYDVRWRISANTGAGTTQLVLVAAKNAGESGNGLKQGKFFSVPITLRALRGN
jgi:prepilin-type N-terminal cleavage/methylation domain-containing protein